ncbi:YcaO-like family protein [Paenibacillus paeoniae]|uniref:YcaO domain-containing protein n=1 Tax=Paenibacillus paeoniae TaxID=2292705 RepID=A0A371PE71_9BACL|nr:YcaO-like family protein [Paenibacillus paeoniae]REK74241.1 hypothetical protein DX130_17000 [Paenibacillus paeoniae]
MLNCILAEEERVLFDASDKIWGIQRDPYLVSILHKLTAEEMPELDPDEALYWGKLVQKMQLNHRNTLKTRNTAVKEIETEGAYCPIISPYELHNVWAIASESGLPVIPVLLNGDTIYVGPLVEKAADYDVFVRKAASNNPLLADKIKIGSRGKGNVLFYVNKEHVHRQRSQIEQAITRLLDEQSPDTVWVIEQGAASRHTFVNRLSSASHEGERDLMNAVDARLGIVSELQSESFRFKGRDIFISVSTTSDLSSYHPDLFAQSNSGAGFHQSDADYSAVGESIERLAAGCFDSARKLAAWQDLSGKAVDPDDFILFSQEQYEAAGFPYRPFTREASVHWLLSRSLMTGEEVYVPAALVQLPYRAASGETRISPAISTGLALGASQPQSILSGIFEVVERDAFASSWFLRLPPNERLDLKDYLDDYAAELDEHCVCQAYDITLDRLFATVVVTIHDNQSGRFMVGAATRFTRKEAVAKAFLEAAQGISYVEMLAAKYKTYGLKEDFNKVDSFQKHAAFYSIHPELRGEAGYVLNEGYVFQPRNEQPFDYTENDPQDDEERLKLAISTLQHAGYDAYWVDMTNRELEQLGAWCSRVIIPGLQPLHGTHRYRFLNPARLKAVRDKYSWSGPLNPYPHPFP